MNSRIKSVVFCNNINKRVYVLHANVNEYQKLQVRQPNCNTNILPYLVTDDKLTPVFHHTFCFALYRHILRMLNLKECMYYLAKQQTRYIIMKVLSKAHISNIVLIRSTSKYIRLELRFFSGSVKKTRNILKHLNKSLSPSNSTNIVYIHKMPKNANPFRIP